jgi:hypothetical protein
MSQAQDASSYIYQGVWIDWSKGKVRGGTVTLSPANSTILVAILAIFVQVTGSQLWKVFQLALHQFRATEKQRDGLYHQQQAVLRNNTSDFSSIWQLAKIGFAWRHQRTISPLRRSFTLVTWALLHFLLFALAGIFSSPLVDAGDAVLSRSPFCGKFNDTYFSSMGSHSKPGMPDHLENEYYAHYQTRCQESQEYAGSCYSNIESLAQCNSMATTRLSWNTTTQQACPFDSSVCLANVPSVIYDTGFLSSHQDLGLNAQEQDRIWYRKRTTCTILNDARFVSDWKNISATANSPAKRVVDAYYGPNPLADRNATYSYSEWDQYYSFDQYSDTNPYQINAPYAAAGDTNDLTSNFVPIPELARADADTTLVFLSFSKFYETAVNDPWFSAQEAVPYPARSNQNTTGTIFKRVRPLTTLGCAEQHQVCTTGNASSRPGNCTPMLGWLQIEEDPNGFVSLNLTSKQQSTFHRVFQAAIESVFPAILQQLAQRDPPLLARRQIQGIVGLGLPDNQWQLETEYWHAIAMAHLQRTVVAYGTGEFAANNAYINISTEPSDKWLCQNLIIRGTSYRSFNLFALIFILVLGLMIVVAGATIEDLVAWVQQKLGRGVSRHEAWTANELLVMQSLLHERDGCGVWSRYQGIPVCGPGETMDVPKRRRGQQHQQHQQHQHKDSGVTSGSSFEMRSLGPQVAVRSLRAGLTNQSDVEYQVLEDADVADRMSYPSLGWGVLPPPGTAL